MPQKMRKRKDSKINLKHFLTQQVIRLQNSVPQEIIEAQNLLMLRKGIIH